MNRKSVNMQQKATGKFQELQITKEQAAKWLISNFHFAGLSKAGTYVPAKYLQMVKNPKKKRVNY